MADRLDVLLGILLDKSAQKDVERGLDALINKMGDLDDAQLNKLTAEMDGLIKQSSEVGQRFAQARREAERLSTSAGKLAQISTGIFAAGTAIVAGAALAAQNYVKFVEQAGIQGDETANRWIAASKRVKNAQLNLGQDAAQALLPVYEKIATLAEKVASFANAHPELVQAGINTGLVVATVGAVGLAVSKGIRLVADFKYLSATAEYSLATANFQRSVQAFLTGSTLGLGGGGATTAASAGALGTAGKAIGTVTLIATSVIIGAELGNTLGNAIAKLIDPKSKDMKLNETLFYGGVRAVEALDQKWVGFLNRIHVMSDGTLNKVNQLLTKTDQWAGAVLGITQEQQQQAQQTRDFQKEADLAQATQSYIQYRQQEVQAEQQYMQQRAQIVQQGAAQLAQIESSYMKQRTQLAQQFAASSAQALDNFNYQQAQALEQFNRNEARATEEYNRNRQQAQQDYQKQEKQSAEDHQREMQRLEEDSQDRQAELISARDALGLVRERRDLAKRQQQAEEDYNVERKRRRQELRQRLQDMDEQFQQERARRREDFEYQQQQATEQFARQQAQAQQQYEQQLKQLDEQHQQEMQQARQQTAEKLRDLQLQFRQEQIARRNAFYDILRDLNANLLGEQQIRLAYYQRMQEDLIKFLNNTANSVPGSTPGSNLPGYSGSGFASGGYTPPGGGIIRVHPDEFISNKETTRALEQMIGGKLTQEGVRSMTNKTSTLNLSFPGGLVTVKMLGDLLEQNNAKMFQRVVKELLG